MIKSFRQGTRVLIWIGLGLALSAAASVSLEHWQSGRVMPLDTVRFDGELGRLQEAELRDAVAGTLDGGFLGIDVALIRRSVEALAWVDTATVRRVWPDALQITIAEQKPVAQWGKQALINAAGQVFQPRQRPTGLPQLGGPSGSAERVLSRYREFRSMLAAEGLEPVRLVLDERRAWTVTLANGGVIQLGREAVSARLARMLAAWPQITNSQQGVLALADLRYPNGFSLRWQDKD